METEEFCILTINLFRHCEKSFVTALDEARIPHGRMQSFTSIANASPVVEVISLPSSQMPWDSLAQTITDWLKRKPGREVVISTDEGTVAHAETHSISELKELLTCAVDILVMDSIPGRQTNRVFRADKPRHKLAS